MIWRLATAAPAVPTPPVGNPPPWANPSCTACKGTGFNSKGRACPICDALAKRNKRPTSGMYLLEGDAQSGFTATPKSEKVAEFVALGVPEVGWSSKGPGDPTLPQNLTKCGIITAPPAPTAAQAPSQPPVVEQRAEAPAALPPVEEPTPIPEKTESEPAPAPGKRGRKPAGITVLIGCSQLKGPDRPSLTAQELLARLGAELAKEMGAAPYWELDAFKRRDRLKQRSEPIAESLGNTVLLVAGVRDPDVDSLVSSLLPHAGLVIEGLR